MEKQEYLNIFQNESSHFFYVGLHDLVINFLDDITKKSRILDAGCGTGGLLSRLKSDGFLHAEGIDLFNEAVRLAMKKGVKVRLASVEKLPYGKNLFDAVVCIDVLYHLRVKSDVVALGELWRVLKPGGLLILRVPANPWMKSGHDEFVHTRHRYEKGELSQKLNQVGFEIKRLTFVHAFLFLIAVVNWNKKGTASAIGLIPGWINKLMLWELRAENLWLRKFDLPAGQGLMAIALKPNGKFRQ